MPRDGNSTSASVAFDVRDGSEGASTKMQARSILRLIRRPLGTTFVASCAIQGLNIVTGVLLARSLGAHGRGELAAILLWTLLVASFGSLGLNEALTYETANGPAAARAAVGSAVATWAVMSVALVLAGAGVLTVALSSYSISTRLSGYLFLAAIPLILATNFTGVTLQGLGLFRSFNIVRALVPGITAATLGVLALSGRLTVQAAVVAYIATYMVTASVGVRFLSKTPAWSTAFSRSTLRRLLRYGIRSQSTLLVSTLVERLDQLLISVFLGATSLGLYAVAVTMTSASTLAASTVALVAFPRLAGLGDRSQQAASARRFIVIAVLASAAVTLPLLAVTPQLLDLFFGAAFVSIADVCRVLLVAGIFLALTQLVAALLRGLGRPLDAGVAGGVGLVVTVILLAVLLPALGLMGAAIASLCAYVVTMIWMLRKLCQALGLSMTEFARRVRTEDMHRENR